MSIVFSLTREHDDWLTLNYCYCTVTLTATCRWPSCNHLPVLGADCPLITITGCSIGNGSGHCPQPMSSNNPTPPVRVIIFSGVSLGIPLSKMDNILLSIVVFYTVYVVSIIWNPCAIHRFTAFITRCIVDKFYLSIAWFLPFFQWTSCSFSQAKVFSVLSIFYEPLRAGQ